MADAALTTVINKTVEIGLNLIVEAGSRLYWLSENIKWIERQMRHFNSCLKDAEAKELQNHEVANLINDMRDLALDIEDLLDTYLPRIEPHKQKGPLQYIKRVACAPCHGATRNAFGLEIEKIKKRVEEIEAERERCGVTANIVDPGLVEDDAWQRGKRFLIQKEPIVVGRDTTLKKLKEEVLSENSKCKKVCVVGEGGVGKTTVVKKLYREVRAKFECSAMVYVSMDPKVSELLRQIAEQVGLGQDKIDQNLEANLQSLLEERRCLIVLDDIWKVKAWDDLKCVIPEHSENGSRIIITSRYSDVGRYIGGDSSLTRLEGLSPEDSRELFTSLLENDMRELEDIGMDIVKRCAGLPLAIAVAAGMLRKRKRSGAEWTKVLESMKTGDENYCLNILSLSYKDLPMELRPLFLYLGIFPEDSEIHIHSLAMALVAEKLIPLDGTRLPEHVVSDQLEKLHDRNLIEVTFRTSTDRIVCCRIHDVLRSLCIDIAKKSNFFSVLDSRTAPNTRRLVLDLTSPVQCNLSDCRAPRLRSLLCFAELYGSRHFTIPEEIGNMSSITHLKFEGRFEVFPSSIWNLKHLQTLDMHQVSFGVVPSIPRSFLKTRSLKHFRLPVNHFIKWPSMKSANCLCTGNEVCVPNLETLTCINGDYIEASILRKLSKLRTLGLRGTKEQHLEVISRATPVFTKLQELGLNCNLQGLDRLNLSGYHYLVKLDLNSRKMEDSVSLTKFPPNLIYLTITVYDMKDDPMEVLKKLPRLEVLTLLFCKSTTNLKLDCSGSNSFPQLQVLEIAYSEFDELIVDDHGMPKLRKFVYTRAFLGVERSPSPDQMPKRIRDLMVERW